jgi:parallel beta-helix repeat protein
MVTRLPHEKVRKVTTVCRRRLSIAFALIFMLSTTCPGPFATTCIRAALTSRTWIVNAHGAGFRSIQEAIDNANDGDTILVNAGTYYEHLVVDKSLSIVGEDAANTVVDGGVDWSTIVIAANNVTIRNLTIQHGIAGVILQKNTEDNKLLENRIVFNSYYGVYGDRCGNNTIANNNVSFNGWHGIFLYGREPCIMDGNSFLFNGIDGVFMWYSSNSIVKGNTASGNGACGIRIQSDEDPERPSGLSKNNVIEDNHIANNTYGIDIRYSGPDTTPAKNQVHNNYIGSNNLGLNVSGSSGNTFFNNNFINNSKQVFVYKSFNNTWDDGYYVGGNYWSDHNGIDLYWNPQQEETGSDGIVDTPYLVSANPAEEDRYPFTRQDGWLILPEINILSPTNGTHRLNVLPLTLNMNKPAQLSYSLDNQPNITITGNTILSDLPIGVHNLEVHANDSASHETTSKIAFTITFVGDLNLDGKVNIIDVSIVAYSFGRSYGNERWNKDADLNNDEQINIIDIAIVAREFGRTILK